MNQNSLPVLRVNHSLVIQTKPQAHLGVGVPLAFGQLEDHVEVVVPLGRAAGRHDLPVRPSYEELRLFVPRRGVVVREDAHGVRALVLVALEEANLCWV